MKKPILIALGIVLFAAAQAQLIGPLLSGKHAAPALWSIVTFTLSGACVTSSNSCSITSLNTTAGHLVVFGMTNGAGNHISSVTLPISGGNIFCFGCAGGIFTSCFVTDAATSFTSDCGYTFGVTTSSGTTFTIVRDTIATAGWRVWYAELAKSTGCTISLDAVGTRDQTTNSTSPIGVTLSIAGPSDAIVQEVGVGSGVTAVTSPYSTNFLHGGTQGVALSINTSSGAPPTWTVTNNKSALSGIAFQCL